MSVSIHCPICRATYDVDEDVVGQSVTCECGQDFTATAEAKHSKTIALGSKLCPNCEEVIELTSVICLECGYNFNTGTVVGSDVGNEDAETDAESDAEVEAGPGIGTKLIPLLKPLIIILILGIISVIGWLLYSSMTAKFYGISDDNPLGTIEELDEHLAKVGLVKRNKVDPLPKEFGTSGKIYRYDNKKMAQKSNGLLRETAFVLVDSNNRVCGAGGAFTPASKAIPGGIGSKVKGFITSYWKETGCVKDKKNTKTITHKGLTASMTWHEYITDSKTGSVHGQWREVSSNGTGLTEGENTVYVVAAGYSGDAIISGGSNGGDDNTKSMLNVK